MIYILSLTTRKDLNRNLRTLQGKMEFKDFSRTSTKIQGLFKTLRILVHWSEDHTSICSNPWSDPESEPLDDRRGLLEPWRKAVSVGSPARLTELIAWTLLGFKPNIFLVMVKSRLQKSSWTWNKTENTVIHCLNTCTDTCTQLASPPTPSCPFWIFWIRKITLLSLML